MIGRLAQVGVVAAATAALLAAGPAGAQAIPPSMAAAMQRGPERLPAVPDPGAIALNTGGVPGMEPEVREMFLGSVTLRNVSHATLTPVLPATGNATGAAVIVMPGGGFSGLAVVSEGGAVAKWFADRGVAAFILRYRLNPTPDDPKAYVALLGKQMAGAALGKLSFPVPPQSFEDAEAALRLVRSRAVEWGVDPRRAGMVGFSAGAILGLAVATSGKPDGPAFIGLLYPPVTAVAVPPDAPPLFIGIAADDPLFGGKGYGLAESWTRAGRPVELHVYQKGSHAFGMGAPGTTTTDWAPSFLHWLQMDGFLGAAR